MNKLLKFKTKIMEKFNNNTKNEANTNANAVDLTLKPLHTSSPLYASITRTDDSPAIYLNSSPLEQLAHTAALQPNQPPPFATLRALLDKPRCLSELSPSVFAAENSAFHSSIRNNEPIFTILK